MQIFGLRRSSERGAVVIQVAVCLLGLLAFTSFVVDYGVLWTSRGQAQTAADAGALAGAISLAYEPGTDSANNAKLKASEVAKQNLVWGQAPNVQLTDVTLGEVRTLRGNVVTAPFMVALSITVKSLGDFSSRISEIRPGTRVVAEGPFGVFTEAARRREKVVLIAGGIGITPIRALMEDMSGDVIVLYRVVGEADLIFREELERLAHERGITLLLVVGDHATREGRRLLSPRHLRELVPDIAERQVYVCGPPAMTEFLERSVRRADVPARLIHTEKFAL